MSDPLDHSFFKFPKFGNNFLDGFSGHHRSHDTSGAPHEVAIERLARYGRIVIFSNHYGACHINKCRGEQFMGRKDDLWENELWTQGEVASYFRVVPGTVKNWRDQGRLSHWQAPGSSRVLYFRNELRDFQEKYTISISKKGGDNAPGLKKIHKGKPVVSSIEEDWRI